MEESMSLWIMLLIICACGFIGGVVNALISDNGFLLPRAEKSVADQTIWRPGFLGTAFVGAIAAGVSWGLYGPFAAYVFVSAPADTTSTQSMGLTLASLAGAVLVGIAGARWLTNEVDKSLLRAAAGVAAGKPANPGQATQIAMASPAGALALARAMP
jgi:hypothetical protein